MTYYDLKELRKQIELQRLIAATAESDEIDCEKEKLKQLESKLQHAIDGIPNEYIKRIIYCKIIKRLTWATISAIMCSGKMSPDAIRKACRRYKW